MLAVQCAIPTAALAKTVELKILQADKAAPVQLIDGHAVVYKVGGGDTTDTQVCVGVLNTAKVPITGLLFSLFKLNSWGDIDEVDEDDTGRHKHQGNGFMMTGTFSPNVRVKAWRMNVFANKLAGVNCGNISGDADGPRLVLIRLDRVRFADGTTWSSQHSNEIVTELSPGDTSAFADQ
jgi:hypothetical protein